MQPKGKALFSAGTRAKLSGQCTLRRHGSGESCYEKIAAEEERA